MRILILSAAGLLATAAMPSAAEAQNRHGYSPDGFNYREVRKAAREYHRKLAEARRECDEELRGADKSSEWIEADHECRREFAKIEREYRKAVRKAHRDWRENRYDDDDDD